MNLDGKRIYVALHPDGPRAVLRVKDSDGLAEWRSRTWDLFRGPPIILDVTDQLIELRKASRARMRLGARLHGDSVAFVDRRTYPPGPWLSCAVGADVHDWLEIAAAAGFV